MRFLSLIWSHLKIGAANELQYRMNFLIQLLQSMIALATGLIGLALVFRYTSELHGWTRPELLAVMGVYILSGGIINSFIQPNMNRLLDEILDGTLDFALTKPVDGQFLICVREFRFWSLTDVLLGLVVVGAAVAQMLERVGLLQILGFLTALVFGILIIYSFSLIMTSIAFWVIRIYEIVEVFQSIYSAARWPVGIYPDWLRIGLTFLVPVAFAVTVPVEALTGRLTPLTLLTAGGLAAALMVLARFIWKRGTRKYSGASA